MSDYEQAKLAIKGQGAWISAAIASLDEATWRKPSNLEGWNIFTLVAHTMRAPSVLLRYATSPLDSAPIVDRFTYYNFNGPTIAAEVSQRAFETAAQTSPATLRSEFDENIQAALALLDKLAPDTVVNSTFGPIALSEYVITRIIELTIHSLDLALSLNISPDFDPTAVILTNEVLEKLLDNQSRPADLTDDIAFLKAASGRERHPGVLIPAFS